MRSTPATVFLLIAALQQWLAHRLELMNPAAVVSHQLIRTSWQRQRIGKTVHMINTRFFIGERVTSFHYIVAIKLKLGL